MDRAVLYDGQELLLGRGVDEHGVPLLDTLVEILGREYRIRSTSQSGSIRSDKSDRTHRMPTGPLFDLIALQTALKKFADERNRNQYHLPKNLAMVLTVEVGELAEIFQWLSEEQSKSVAADEAFGTAVRDELADVFGAFGASAGGGLGCGGSGDDSEECEEVSGDGIRPSNRIAACAGYQLN